MILRPTRTDLKIILFYSGKIILGIGCLMVIPLIVSLLFAEWPAAFDFLIGAGVCVIYYLITDYFFYTKKELGWGQGMVVVAFSWVMATTIGAIPHFLSAHFFSYLDATFDLMSGYTTTGLYLIQDLDHVSNALNTWRHLLTYAGGQGIIVIALTFLVRPGSGGVKIYVSEGKDEKLMPNVMNTARTIWMISLVYMVIGTIVLLIMNLIEGQGFIRGLFHSWWVFMGAWSTGGFAPQSYNIGYYHSAMIEIFTMLIFVIGSFNFALHWAVWRGDRKEIYRNIETVAFVSVFLIAFSFLTIGLIRFGFYSNQVSFFRKGFFHLISGQTTTGFMTIYSREFVRHWGDMSMAIVSTVMAIGASACSTAGGIKGIRIGIIFKGIKSEIKKLILPESAVLADRFHHIKDIVMESYHFKMAAMIALAYIITYFIGTMAGLFYGYPMVEALFDSVSAGSNTGLSCGVTSPFMPALMKIIYIIEMWMGRLEFLAVFTFFGFIYALFKGK